MLMTRRFRLGADGAAVQLRVLLHDKTSVGGSTGAHRVTVDDIAERVIHAACLCTSRRTVPVSEYRVPEDGAGLPVGPLARRPLGHQEVVAIISPASAAAIAGLIWHVPL
jgi:hypothetical protein